MKKLILFLLFLLIIPVVFSLEITTDKDTYLWGEKVNISGKCKEKTSVIFQFKLGGETVSVDQTKTDSNGNFEITYNPTSTGNYNVYVSCSGEVKSKSFSVSESSTQPATSDKVTLTGKCKTPKIQSVIFDFYLAENKISVDQTKTNLSGGFTISYSPSQEGKYIVYFSCDDGTKGDISFCFPAGLPECQITTEEKPEEAAEEKEKLEEEKPEEEKPSGGAWYDEPEEEPPSPKVCVYDWKCTDWSSCQAGFKTRTCQRFDQCEQWLKEGKYDSIISYPKPNEKASCLEKKEEEVLEKEEPPEQPVKKPKPTCFDKIQNQGEEGIDCGGPCPPCPKEEKKSYLWLWILIIVLAVAGLGGFFLYKKSTQKPSPGLTNYVKTYLQKGFEKEAIREKLLQSGYSKKEINQVFKKI